MQKAAGGGGGYAFLLHHHHVCMQTEPKARFPVLRQFREACLIRKMGSVHGVTVTLARHCLCVLFDAVLKFATWPAACPITASLNTFSSSSVRAK